MTLGVPGAGISPDEAVGLGRLFHDDSTGADMVERSRIDGAGPDESMRGDWACDGGMGCGSTTTGSDDRVAGAWATGGKLAGGAATTDGLAAAIGGSGTVWTGAAFMAGPGHEGSAMAGASMAGAGIIGGDAGTAATGAGIGSRAGVCDGAGICDGAGHCGGANVCAGTGTGWAGRAAGSGSIACGGNRAGPLSETPWAATP